MANARQCYIIAYDLHEGADYKALHDAIKSYGTWARITESTWAVVTSKTAEGVRNHLGELMDAEDRIFVVRSGVESAWRNPRCRSEWLKEYI